VARSGGETKAAATEVLEKLLVTLADSRSGPEARGDAIVALATMIGAMTMARIVSGTLLSDEILNRAKDHLHR
jgi:TetR/AcrR family transcriptional repressor of nem operon